MAALPQVAPKNLLGAPQTPQPLNSGGMLPPAPPPSSAAPNGMSPSPPGGPVTNPNVNGVDPVNIHATPMGGYQPFIDSAYQQSASRLDPQYAQSEAAFRQRMVNQGLSEGGQAYNDAYGNFSRERNDAYAGARNAAFGQGLAAQGQGFSQGQQQAQLAQAMSQWNDQRGLQSRGLDLQGQQMAQQNAQFNTNMGLQRDQFNESNRQFGQNFGEDQRRFNNQYGLQRDQFNQAGQQWGQNFGLQRDQFNQAGNQWNQQFGQNQHEFNTQAGLARDQFGEQRRQFDGTMGLNRDQFDTNTMMGLSDRDMRAFELNQGAQQQNWQMAQAMLGLIPGMGPNQIDTYQPYGLQANSINQQNANASQQNNGMWGAIGGIGAAFLSSRSLKEVGSPVDLNLTLQAVRSLPVDRWQYIGDGVQHIGTFAEDFNAALGLDAKPYIHQVDLFGALMASIQALADKVDKLEKSHV